MQDIGFRVRAALIRVAGALVILALVGVVNRLSPTGEVAEGTLRCDFDPPRDIRQLEACLERSPHDVELSIHLGDAYASAGRFDDAIEAYRAAVAADPHDAEARVRLGSSLHRAGDQKGARREGAAALALRPNDPIALMLVNGPAAAAGVHSADLP